jgi:hypothetical protein
MNTSQLILVHMLYMCNTIESVQKYATLPIYTLLTYYSEKIGVAYQREGMGLLEHQPCLPCVT